MKRRALACGQQVRPPARITLMLICLTTITLITLIIRVIGALLVATKTPANPETFPNHTFGEADVKVMLPWP